MAIRLDRDGWAAGGAFWFGFVVLESGWGWWGKGGDGCRGLLGLGQKQQGSSFSLLYNENNTEWQKV